MKKVLYTIGLALLAVSCTEDYTDWANPFKNDPEAAKTMTMSITPAGTIDLATVTTEAIQLFSPSITIDDEAETTYQATIYGPEEGDKAELEVGADGYVLTEGFETAVYGLYGQRPVERSIPMDVVGLVKVGGQTFKAVANTTLKVIPNAPEIEAAYYLTGNINGWNNSDKTYKLTNDGSDPYENPTFTVRINAPEDGSNVEFKMTPESGLGGDWSKCLAAGDEGKFKYNNDGGNLVITAVPDAVYYDLVFNMLDQTWSANALVINIEQAYYLTGSINGWNNSDTTYKLTNDGTDPYANPTFTMRIPAPEDGGNVEFKMTPESGLGGDWSKCLASGKDEGTFAYNNGGNNLVINAVEGAKYYDLTFNMMDLTWSCKAVNFDPVVYFIGATDGWANPDQKLALTDESGIYTGYIYCADPNSWGNCFKFQKVAGDWGTEINTGHMTGGMTGGVGLHDGDTNFEIKDGEGVYYMTLDLANNTLNALKVEKMGIIGDFNGWGGDVEMTWNATDYCFEATGAGVNANGWKFRINADWGINLGSNDSVEPSTVLTDLVANGKNIGVAGTTIKLYPTRKTSDNIYCTVE